ncbi:MAG: hypothetical protein JSR48_15320 [Verrucomicrobia bacterium]|nr:hypothetical protein [Verrucomicrobiota bacterium]
MRWPIIWIIGGLMASVLPASELTLERTIPLPGVVGRIDHFALDSAGHRLFVAALGNNTVEVVDLAAGRVEHTLAGLSEPQGLFHLAEARRLYVANGGDGAVRVYDEANWTEAKVISFEADADNLRYDATTRRLYVGHGDALAAVDVDRNEAVSDTALPAHPESFQSEREGRRIFVNLPEAHAIGVIDPRAKRMVAQWTDGLAGGNFPMVLDEADHRLMVACRRPACLMVYDTETGRPVAKVALHGDCDDLFFDATRREIYASCGEGFIDVFRQVDPEHYTVVEAVKTDPGARTCLVDGAHLYLAVPRRGHRTAEIRCYRLVR